MTNKPQQEDKKNVLIISAPPGPPKDLPWEVVIEQVTKHVEAGRLCYQKFTCSGCGQRLTIETPNHFHMQGSCDRCSTITDIKKQGCGYLLEAHNVTGKEALELASRRGRP